MKFNTAFLLAVVVPLIGACNHGPSFRLQHGEACILKFSRFRDQGKDVPCFGNLIVGAEYSLRYERTGRTWDASGETCSGGTLSHIDPGADPASGVLSIWGASWRYDSLGNVKDKDGETVGILKCPEPV